MIFFTTKNTFKNKDCQQTLKKQFSFSGKGLHSGEICKVTISPAKENTGIILQNQENKAFHISDALIYDTQLGTSISFDNFQISTIEHLLSAFFGLGIDNAIIHIVGKEIPIIDGSSLPFVKMILEAGIQKQLYSRVYIAFSQEVEFLDGDKFLKIIPSKRCYIDLTIDFSEPIIGKQNLQLELNQDTYINQIAPARTFCRFKDIELLKSLGLGKGGSYDNAIIIDHDKILNDTKLRIKKEFAAHKMLDFLGDFYLTGYRFLGDIVAYKTGHTLNAKFISEIRNYMKNISIAS